MRRILCVIIAAAWSMCLTETASAAAASYPVRPVRVIVPYAPGGGSDILARLLAIRISEEMRQQFVVDNRPGGNAMIGTQIVARAAPDGYTIGMIDTAFTINPGLFGKMPYDAVKDFAPISLIASSPIVLVVNASVPVKSVKELIALAKSSAGKMTFSSAGNGTAIHLAGELFKMAAGVDLVHIPYKGGGPSVVALAGGEVSVTFSPPATVMPHLRSGKARALAITGARRFAGLPEVPTLIESGVSGVDAEPFWGMVAPAGTPPAVVKRLADVFARHVHAVELRQRLLELAFNPVGDTPEQFAAYIKADIAKWGRVIKASGARPE